MRPLLTHGPYGHQHRREHEEGEEESKHGDGEDEGTGHLKEDCERRIRNARH